jgi:hypothetical protein
MRKTTIIKFGIGVGESGCCIKSYVGRKGQVGKQIEG